MAQSIQCPRCFASAIVQRSPGRPIHLGLCPHCGLEFEVSEKVLRQASYEAPASGTSQVDEVQKKYTRRVILLAVVIPALCIFAGLLMLGLDRLSASRNQRQLDQSRARIEAISTEADRLASLGRLPEARQKYAELVTAASALRSTDSEVLRASDDARAQMDALQQEIQQRAAAQAAPKPAPPPALAPTTAVAVAAGKPASPQPAAQAARPAPRPAPTDPNLVTDADVERAIERGVAYLLTQFNLATYEVLDPTNSREGEPAEFCGRDALCVYALMQAGLAGSDERLSENSELMRNLIDRLKELPATGAKVTYARGIRATALAVFNRSQDRRALEADVAYLLATHNRGAYFYSGTIDEKGRPGPTPAGLWDNSNSQYGLLGVWAAAEVGVPAPAAYWTAVEQHWVRTQCRNGQWDYNEPGDAGTLSMTAAGTASLFVAHDYLTGSRVGLTVGRDSMSPSLRRAMDWWESTDSQTLTAPNKWWGYTLYGIERVGLASGMKFLGATDWYRTLSRQAVVKQLPNGSWGDDIETAYALLFLARGRHPVLVNKLRFDGSWANRPRDMANLTRYASRKLERQINWQVVGLRTPWHQWLNAPILYMASHAPVALDDADCDRLRQYVEAGGLLFTQADADWPQFNEFAAELAKRLFPNYPLAEIPLDHPIYNLVIPVESKPPLLGVSNGVRLLMVHSPKDIARYWHARAETSRPDVFDLGTNLLVYAGGRRDLRNRLDTPYIEPPSQAPIYTTAIARVQYGGNWDPEPGAWRRFAAWFERKTGSALDPRPVPAVELSVQAAPFAHLTGVGALSLDSTEADGLRKYVADGGVLLIDAAGGDVAFADSARKVLEQIFTESEFAPLPTGHSLFRPSASGMDDLTKPRVRVFAIEKFGTGAAIPRLESLAAGKGHVLLSPLDITSGLLGTRTWSIAGYSEDFAPLLLKNMLFWTLDGQKP